MPGSVSFFFALLTCLIMGIKYSFYANPKSLRNKFAELRAYVSQENPNVIFIRESWEKVIISLV